MVYRITEVIEVANFLKQTKKVNVHVFIVVVVKIVFDVLGFF